MSEAPGNGPKHRGRGELTPEGRRRAALNAVRHNAYGRSTVPRVRHCPLQDRCGGCGPDGDAPCPVFTEVARQLFQELAALPHLRREHHPLLGEYVSTFVRIQVLDRFVQRAGLVRVDGQGLDTHPVVRHLRGSLANLLCRLSDQLGLNPAAMKALKLDDPLDVGGDPALALQAALERREREAEEAAAAEGAPREEAP